MTIHLNRPRSKFINNPITNSQIVIQNSQLYTGLNKTSAAIPSQKKIKEQENKELKDNGNPA